MFEELVFDYGGQLWILGRVEVGRLGSEDGRV